MTQSHSIEIDGRSIPVRVRRSGRATRLSLRIDRSGEGVVLVMPPAASLSHALGFAAQQRDWIGSRLAAMPPKVDFRPGALVPVLGVEHVIRHCPEARRGVWAEDGAIHVSGAAEHLPRRIGDWLRRRAAAEISTRAHPLAARIGRKICRISLRDTTSRWGSCTAAGNLSFSWRLILAPEAVLTYVVAHEVAHLAHMDHSPAFWRLVGQLTPDPDSSRAWLKRHGASLHRYG